MSLVQPLITPPSNAAQQVGFILTRTKYLPSPVSPLAWLPPKNLSGYKEAPPIRDGLLTMMVDLADNLGPHTEQAQQVTLCCDGLVVSGRLIGAQEYLDGMRETIISLLIVQ